MPSTKRVVIVGAGVVGLSAAYFALQRGHHVTVLERGGPDHDCCSLGNAGMIVPSHFVPLAAPGMIRYGLRMMLNPEGPFYIRPRLNRELIGWALKFCRSANKTHVERAAPLLWELHLASRACYEEFAGSFGNFGLTQKGLLMICNTQARLREEAELAKMACRLGLEGQLLTAQETAKLDPGVRMEIAGAVYYPEDCHLVPQKLMSELTSAAQSAGADIHWSTEVTGWRWKDNEIEAVMSSGGEYDADEFVIAAGSWSSAVVRQLGIKLPMQAGKGYSMTLSKPEQIPNLGSILMEARVAVTPMGEDLRFAGTMEIAGLDLSINSRRVNGIINSVCRYFPEFRPDHFRGVPVWAGLRPCSPDGLPYIGRFRRYPNLVAATGHAMMGLSLGPISGKLVAECLSGMTTSIPLNQLSPDRFG